MSKKFPLKGYKLMPAEDLPMEIGPGIRELLLKENPKLKLKRGLLGWILPKMRHLTKEESAQLSKAHRKASKISKIDF